MTLEEVEKLLDNSQDKLWWFLDDSEEYDCEADFDEHLRLISKYLNDDQIVKLIKSDYYNSNLEKEDLTQMFILISDNEKKLKLLEDPEFVHNYIDIGNYATEITKDFSYEQKEEFVLKTFKKNDIINIIFFLADCSVDFLIKFANKNKQFLNSNDIKLYEITNNMLTEKQREILNNIDEFDLPLSEKKMVIVSVSNEVKEKYDKSKVADELRSAFELEFKSKDAGEVKFLREMRSKILGEEYTGPLEAETIDYSLGDLTVDLTSDFKKYRGLDEYIKINPKLFSPEQKEKFLELCKTCPNLKVADDIVLGVSSVSEYIEAEKWIDLILSGIDENWNDLQKLAYIDNQIGRKISYSPDFKTEVFNEGDARALWKIISSGYGVCNGVAQVEQYILKKIGIDSEMIDGDGHTFLLIKDIDIPKKDGTIVKGNTFVDPTWNLADHRYGMKPCIFGADLNKVREEDISYEGIDSYAHKPIGLGVVQKIGMLYNIDKAVLNDVFKSVGILNKDGSFPIIKLYEKSLEINKDQNLGLKDKIEAQLSCLSEYEPTFATCQNSTMSCLSLFSLSGLKKDFDRCVIKRVYDKNDDKKRPIVYVYVDSPETGELFYIADDTSKSFQNIPKDVFVKSYDCYERDGEKPWKEEELEINKITDDFSI